LILETRLVVVHLVVTCLKKTVRAKRYSCAKSVALVTTLITMLRSIFLKERYVIIKKKSLTFGVGSTPR